MFARVDVNRRFVIRLHCRPRPVYPRMQTDLIRQVLIIDTANCSLIICSATRYFRTLQEIESLVRAMCK